MKRVSADRFVNAHMRQPKGWGRWLFENKEREVVFIHTGNYGDARKAAEKFARENDSFIYVCP